MLARQERGTEESGCKGAFAALDKRICERLLKLGIAEPTDIQEKAIPVILSGVGAVLVAPTGSGKTEAALLPLFHLMLVNKDSGDGGEGPSLVYITPLRALNRDIFVRMEELSKSIGLRSLVRHGDSSTTERRLFVQGGFDWFITTPESFTMLLTHEKTRDRLKSIRYVVVDEVHELVDDERGSELEVSLRRLEGLTGGFQFVGLSATLPDPELPKRFFPCRGLVKRECVVVASEPSRRPEVVVDTSGLSGFFEHGKHLEYVSSKLEELRDAYRSVLLFVNTRSTAEALAHYLASRGLVDVRVHHGSLSTSVRKEAEKGFKDGDVWCVVATSSLELGIDIGHLDIVVQYGSPRQVARLVQRAGRSGHRVGKEPRALILAEPLLDDVVESMVIARRTLAGILETQIPHKGPLDVLLHQLVGMVLAKEAKTFDDFVRILRKSYSFSDVDRQLLQRVLDYAVEVGLLKTDGERVFPARKSHTYFFSTNMIPDTARIPVYSHSGEKIGYLDEDFVLARLAKGARLVLAGQEWLVLEVGDREVRVAPAEPSTGLPPAWEGDLIPVDWKVAREECCLLSRAFKEGKDGLRRAYPFVSENALEFVTKVVEEARRGGFVPPGPGYVLLESDGKGEVAVAYTCLGSKGNDLLSMLLAYYVTNSLGKRVLVASDPLRVYLKVTGGDSFEVLNSALRGLANDVEYFLSEEVLRAAIKSSNMFVWKLSQVAKKMGMVSRDMGLREAARLVKFLADTIAGEEAVRELLVEKLEVTVVRGLLEDLRKGAKRVIMQPRRGLSPFTTYGGRGALRIHVREHGLPVDLAIRMLERRALEKEMVFACMVCGYSYKSVISELPDSVSCPRCSAKLVCPIPIGFEEMLEALRSFFKSGKDLKLLNENHKELVMEAVERAELVLVYGKPAVIALSVYGIGPRSAKKALGALKFGWNEFLRVLYLEQLNWFRTREYWD